MIRWISFFALICILFSCGNNVAIEEDLVKKNTDNLQKTSDRDAKIIEPIQDEEVVVLEVDGIRLTELKVVNYPNASIRLETKQFEEGWNNLVFNIEGLKDYAFSIIENNYTISSHSSNVVEKEFLYGNNVFLAFLTDEKGVSLKTNKANVLKNVTLGEESLFDMNQPHLFYYLPAVESDNLVLDFYLLNTTLSEGGNKVLLKVNDTEFILSKWAAYKIEGVDKGIVSTFRIQLIDKNGDLIEGPFNDSGDRKFEN